MNKYWKVPTPIRWFGMMEDNSLLLKCFNFENSVFDAVGRTELDVMDRNGASVSDDALDASLHDDMSAIRDVLVRRG